MTPEELAAVNQLRDQYDSIHDNLDALLDACESAAQRRQVGDALQVALKAYIEGQSLILGKSAELVEEVTSTATKAVKAVKKALKDLTNIKETLNTITKVVNNVATVVAALA